MARIINSDWIKEVKIKVPKNDTDYDILIFKDSNKNILTIKDLSSGCMIIFNDENKNSIKFEFMAMEKTYHSITDLKNGSYISN